MTTLTIEIPENVETTLSDLIEKLGGKVISKDLENKAAKKNEVLNALEESVKFIKSHQAGNGDAKSLEQLMNEL
ncbi:hypothetical protein [Mucilaginibacter ginkgonis]|uniref:Uncharacterized protein n=1 Tax=Mucilaginibacter ginkgonis TaxID=2682091 RepID=A0A6I4I5T7_9SPHI|nr:hypothetical protein [Mucilaginibacter ginkgonis]QQL48538.1 hypothetical protein GO620_010075 [Mucilaginibacter ginkgonis]